MKKETIQLYNRYRNNIYLEQIDKNKWKLCGDLNYCRIIFDDNEMTKIKAVDPDGGPFICVDLFEIKNNKIKTIQDIDGYFYIEV